MDHTRSSPGALPLRPRSLPCGRVAGWIEPIGQSAAQIASTSATALIEALAGLVERVTHHNVGNGFCVLRVKARGHKDPT